MFTTVVNESCHFFFSDLTMYLFLLHIYLTGVMLRDQDGSTLFMFSAISVVRKFKPLFQNPKSYGAGEMAQQLRAFAALAEDQGLVLSTCMATHKSL